MYRPTVRYSDIYKSYVDDVFRVTRLDRNQIIRLALFLAAHSDEYKAILEKYKNSDVPLPHPDWGRDEHQLWKSQNYSRKEQNDLNIKDENLDKPIFVLKDQGKITFTLN